MTPSIPMPPFGKEMREKEFMFANTYLPLNHGSYGTYPITVHKAKLQWQELTEARPDHFMRKTYLHQLIKCRGIVAKEINADRRDCVFIPNVTTGMNEVMHSLDWKPGDVLLCYSSAYGACEKVIHYVCDRIPGVKLQKLTLDYPISDDEIVRLTEQAIKKDSNIKLIMMDAISSLPGLRFPWERICALCRKHNILSLVDGAHAITQIPIDIRAAAPDFFVSNLHKWSYVPRGCAVLYVRHELQRDVHALPIGHGYVSSSQASVPSPVTVSDEGVWVVEHEWPATIDWSGYLSVDTAFEFIDACGGADKIRAYCHNLAVEGGEAVAGILGTEVLRCEGSEYIANMVNIKLPLALPDDRSATQREEISAQREYLFDRLFERDAFPYPYVVRIAGEMGWWVRFSAQIYLDLDDFKRGAEILKEICEAMAEKKWG